MWSLKRGGGLVRGQLVYYRYYPARAHAQQGVKWYKEWYATFIKRNWSVVAWRKLPTLLRLHLAGVAGRNYGTVHYIWEPSTYVVFSQNLARLMAHHGNGSAVSFMWDGRRCYHLTSVRPCSSLSPHRCWTTSYLTDSPYCWQSHYTACGVWHSFRVQVLENLWTF